MCYRGEIHLNYRGLDHFAVCDLHNPLTITKEWHSHLEGAVEVEIVEVSDVETEDVVHLEGGAVWVEVG